MYISTYDKLTNTSYSNNSKELNNIFYYIKNHPNKNNIEKARLSGKYDDNLNFSYKSYSKNEQSLIDMPCNFYNYVKYNESLCVTWSLDITAKNIKRQKHLIENNDFTNLIYFDMDVNDENHMLHIRKFLEDDSYDDEILAVWKSFGGKGLGFLIKVKNLNKENFLSTWTFLKDRYTNQYNSVNDKKEYDFKIDPATKDYTRINVLSYDNEILYRNINEVDGFYVSQEVKDYLNNKYVKKNNSVIVHKKNIVSEEYNIKFNHMDYLIKNLYDDRDLRTPYTHEIYNERLNYTFYVKFSSKCNIHGISLDEMMDFLTYEKTLKKYPLLFLYRNYDEIYSYCENIYNTYSNDFLKISENWIGLENYNVIGNNDIIYDKSYIMAAYNYYKNIFNLNTIFNDKKIFALALNMKRNGFNISHFKDILYKDGEEYIKTFKNVYNNPVYPYNLKIQYKPDVLKNNLNKWIEKNIKYNKMIVKKSLFLTTDEIYNCNKNLQKYAFECLRNNVKKDIAVKYFLSKNLDINNVGEIKFIIDYIYFNHSYQNGYSVIDAHKKITKEYNLKENQYINDIGLNNITNKIIFADTNSGKTDFICNRKELSIIVLPTISLLHQVSNDYDYEIFHSENNNLSNEIKICTTYDSLPKLYKELKNNGTYNVDDYHVHFDEFHYILTAADNKFKRKVMNNVLDMLPMLKAYTFYTGTYLHICHDILNKLDIIRIKKERKKINYELVEYKNRNVSIESNCVKNKLNIIYFQNKNHDGHLGSMVSFFEAKGWDKSNMMFINSNDCVNINNIHIPSNIELCFCTSLINEGINLYNDNIETINFVTFENPEIYHQFVSRFRKGNVYKCYIYLLDTTNENNFYNYIDYQYNYLSYVKKKENLLLNISDNYNEFILKDLKDSSIFRYNELSKNYVIDILEIAYSSFQKRKSFLKKNIDTFKNILEEYQWVYNTKQINDNDLTDNDNIKQKSIFNDKKEKIKNEKNIFLKNIISNEENYKINNLKNFLKRKNLSWQNKIYSLMYYLKNNNISWEECILFLNEFKNHNFSSKSYDLIKNRIFLNKNKSKITNFKLNKNLYNNQNKEIIMNIINNIHDKNIFSLNELIKIFKNIENEKELLNFISEFFIYEINEENLIINSVKYTSINYQLYCSIHTYIHNKKNNNIGFKKQKIDSDLKKLSKVLNYGFLQEKDVLLQIKLIFENLCDLKKKSNGLYIIKVKE